MDLFSQVSEVLTSQQNGWAGQTSFIASGTPLAKKSSNTIGRKPKVTPTSQKQISLFGEERSTSSPVDSHANPTAPQESDLAKKMTVTSGLKCLEQYGRFNHATLWAKMFPGLLIGMGGWFSKRCKLSWKLKATRSGRLYFQLVPSTLPTEGIEYGLLPMPQAIDGNGQGRDLRLKKDSNRDPNQPGSWRGDLKDYASNGLLPTPIAGNMKNGCRQVPGGRIDRKINQGWTIELNDLAVNSLLPTPVMSNYKGANSIEALEARGRLKQKADNLADQFAQHGISSQLNPRFVLEMMGFPPDWTELPFLSGETNPSKPEETPSSPK